MSYEKVGIDEHQRLLKARDQAIDYSMYLDRCIDDLVAELAERDAALAAARALLAKMDAVHADPRYVSVWTVNQLHMGPYRGPNYEDEMADLRAALGPAALPPDDGYLHTTLHGAKVKVLLDD